MTTTESGPLGALRALAGKWRAVAHELRYNPAAMPFSAQRVEDCADQLDDAIDALATPGAGVVVPERLTAENGAKAALMGERYAGELVSWSAIKEVHRAVVELFGNSEQLLAEQEKPQ